MGYSHSWDIKTPITEHELNMVSAGLKKIIEMTDTIICGPDGLGEPTITSKEISFNGDSNTNNRAEPFVLITGMDENNTFGTCKTQRLPYDKLVLATFILLKYYKKDDFVVVMDERYDNPLEGKNNWEESIRLVKKILPEKEIDIIVEEIKNDN